MGGDLYALDFDGVLCDSCGESSLSAIKVSFSVLRLVSSAELGMREICNCVFLVDPVCYGRLRR
jgi:hypothetical protein